MSAEFCDTNVLVYANDPTAGAKHERATQLVGDLWDAGNGVVSVQVLQELFVILTRKLPAPMSAEDARAVLEDLTTWSVVEPTKLDVLAAIDACVRWQISFWDAMVLVAAQKVGAGVLWSEDLNDGQDYDGIVVRNPFTSPRPHDSPKTPRCTRMHTDSPA